MRVVPANSGLPVFGMGVCGDGGVDSVGWWRCFAFAHHFWLQIEALDKRGEALLHPNRALQRF